MGADTDPFAHHPALRDKIADPLQSYFRSFEPASVDAMAKAAGYDTGWRYPDAKVETDRLDFLAQHVPGDLWVFAYGSLMWDPAFRFAEVRRARITGYERRFCLLDPIGRGSTDRPGLMAALDLGSYCDGMVFRIPKDWVEEESGYIWRRELFASGYTPVFAEVATALGAVCALTVVANRASEAIFPDLSLAEQARYIGTGSGFMGTSRDYIEKIAEQLATMGIDDPTLQALLTEVRAVAAAVAGVRPAEAE